jgi:hypothetical protein
MVPRPTTETIETLRRTLKQFEQTEGATNDPVDMTEMRRILLQRVAELEKDQTRHIVATPQEP